MTDQCYLEQYCVAKTYRVLHKNEEIMLKVKGKRKRKKKMIKGKEEKIEMPKEKERKILKGKEKKEIIKRKEEAKKKRKKC